MVTIIWPLLVALAGALIYAFAIDRNPKLAEIGRILFFCGTFWTVYLLAGSTFALARR